MAIQQIPVVTGPTLAQIDNSVATNSPSANNWTFIATAAPSAATDFTISGLTGYKTLLVVAYFTTVSAGLTMGMRINNATDTCTVGGVETRSGSSTTTIPRGSITNGNSYRFATGGTVQDGANSLFMQIQNCTGSGTNQIKPITSRAVFQAPAGTPCEYTAAGHSTTTSAVSSLVFTNLASGLTFTGNFYVFGAN